MFLNPLPEALEALNPLFLFLPQFLFTSFHFQISTKFRVRSLLYSAVYNLSSTVFLSYEINSKLDLLSNLLLLFSLSFLGQWWLRNTIFIPPFFGSISVFNLKQDLTNIEHYLTSVAVSI